MKSSTHVWMSYVPLIACESKILHRCIINTDYNIIGFFYCTFNEIVLLYFLYLLF